MDEPTYQHILFEQAGPIAYLTMNRPAKRNALSVEHMQELIGCLKANGARTDLAVGHVSGNGPTFCAGHDLGEMIVQPPEFYQHEFAICSELMQTITGIPQPVIAQVQGIA